LRRRFEALGVGCGSIAVVHDGVDPSRYRPLAEAQRTATRRNLGILGDELVVLYAGRLTPAKGVETLLEAVARLRSSVPRVRLLLLGCHPWTTAEGTYARRLQERRGPHTWLPPTDDVVPYYGAADVIVMPSVEPEGLGNVAIEAMACERPVVACGVGGLQEVFADALAQLLVKPGDPAALASKLAWALGWRQHSPELGRLCREHVLRSFTLADVLDGFEQVLWAARDQPRRLRPRARVDAWG
jgi:glycosyltransferase involved in cell wall biosynthesis